MSSNRSAVQSAGELRRQAHEQWRKDDDVRALLEERRGYVQRAQAAADAGDEQAHGRMVSRVSQVDDALRSRDAGDAIPGDALPKMPRRSARKSAAAADDSGDGGSGDGGDGSGDKG